MDSLMQGSIHGSDTRFILRVEFMVLALDLWKQSLCHGRSTRLMEAELCPESGIGFMEAELNPWKQHWIHGNKAEFMEAAMESLMRSSIHGISTGFMEAGLNPWKRQWIHGCGAQSMKNGTGLMEAWMNQWKRHWIHGSRAQFMEATLVILSGLNSWY